MISPDREFPAEVRHLLNEIFGEIAQRARKVDLRTLLLRDMCDLFTEQLELYRLTKSTVGMVSDGDLRLSSKDRAFQQEMKTNRTLHAAFYSRDGHYRMIRRMSEGVVSVVLKKDVHESRGLKALARELVSSCVLRQIVLLFTPYNASKWLLAILSPKEYGKMVESSDTSHPSEDQDAKRSLQESSSFKRVEFDQRVRKSVLMEEKDQKKGPKTSSSKSPSIIQSKSHPNLRSRDLDKDPMDSTLQPELDLSTDSSLASFSDLKDVMEETDLLNDESLELPETSLESGRGVTSSMPSASWELNGSVPESSPTKISSDVFNRQISVEGIGFDGQPRACVVAPEINTNKGREYVVFKIRVADQSGEWTVARRYRNFEALHKLLRDVPAYRELNPRLPPKRIFSPSHKTEIVEQRRVDLDRDQSHRSFKPDVNVGLVKLIVDNVDNARYQIKRKVVDSLRPHSRNEIRAEKALRGMEDSEDSSIAGSVKQEDDVSANLVQSVDLNSHTFVTHSNGADKRKDSGVLEGLSPFANEKSFSFQGVDQHRMSKTATRSRFANSRWTGHAVFCDDYNLPDKLSNDNLMSRFEYQDRDAIGRQVEESATGFSDFPLFDTQPINGGINGSGQKLRRVRSWHRFAKSTEVLGDEQDGVNYSSPEELEFEDCTGISAPLYEVADAIFNISSQNVFRRQFYQVMRQILSLLAGGAIDVHLNEKIKRLRSEHTIAWLIHWLKSLLWPGGVWFTTTTIEQEDKSSALKSMSFLDVDEEEPDAKEVAEQLRVRLFRRAPAALVRLVGQNSYRNAMKDVYDMIQLKTFVRQIGYGVLEIGLLALFPELKELFAKIHMEAKSRPESH
eukprot:g2773.t1